MKAPAREVVGREGVLVIAHRGASASAPENTLHAFRRALDAQADLVELDYHHSRDGEPCVFHDKTLDRTTDAVARWGGEKLPLSARTTRELRELDAGAWFAERFRGAVIPDLGAALDVIQDGSTTLIERKAGDAGTLVALLERKALLQHVVVQAFDWEFLAACRARAPHLVLGALGSRELSQARLDRIHGIGVAVVGWNHRYVDAAAVEAVHARGLKLWVYTVNDADRARELVALGVDGVITDRPAAIRTALQKER
ncbi:MAG: glycerophosphodiester phosphodiesterase family protein [Planctomycetota bacterium]|nr:glycerophosphodiester phosphodiesterase family protein [Planctomycetota bacterium]